MRVFWQHGYEGATLALLQEATGLRPPSIYNAFGSKDGLYEACLEHYAAGAGARTTRSIAAGTADRAGVEAFLLAAAREFTAPDTPPGCMISTAALNLGPELEDVARRPADRRAATLARLTGYLERAQASGTLPADVRPDVLARFFGAVIQGMSVQARDGATTDELVAVARTAMAAWSEPPP